MKVGWLVDHTTGTVFDYSSSFRCQAPAECVPLFSSDGVVGLPVSDSNDPLRILGRCVAPCSQDCSNGAQSFECGIDGRTYYNACFRNCANIQVSFNFHCICCVHSLKILSPSIPSLPLSLSSPSIPTSPPHSFFTKDNAPVTHNFMLLPMHNYR